MRPQLTPSELAGLRRWMQQHFDIDPATTSRALEIETLLNDKEFMKFLLPRNGSRAPVVFAEEIREEVENLQRYFAGLSDSALVELCTRISILNDVTNEMYNILLGRIVQRYLMSKAT